MSKNLLNIINKMQNKKVMLIGDMVADIYLKGKISRISREAPVLVLEHAGEKIVPGGAANAVHNTATLGGKVYAAGVLGQDEAGKGLISIFKDLGINTEGLINDALRPTITKTRVIAGGLATVSQQVVRIDRESKEKLSPTAEQNLLNNVKKILTQVDAVVMSDYGSGTLTPAIRKYIITMCRERSLPCIVDSRYDILSFQNVPFVKQNEAEASAAANIDITDMQSLLEAGRVLLEKIRADGVLITRGAEGMTLFEANGAVHHIPVTNVSEVYDVTGAGDTAVATMILALAAGADTLQAARLSNFAAGVAVRKLGTATVSANELRKTIGEYNDNSQG